MYVSMKLDVLASGLLLFWASVQLLCMFASQMEHNC